MRAEPRPVSAAEARAEATPAAPVDLAGFELLPDRPPSGLVRRLFTTYRHLFGLLFGGLAAYARGETGLAAKRRSRLLHGLARLLAALARPFLDKSLVARPFPVQLRRRLEILGPTYIKLGQVLALRQDLLPPAVTEELKNLLDRLPVVSFPRYLELIAADLRRPVGEMFASIDPAPIGSASIAQIHRATTREGDSVILKVVKPGIRETLNRDAKLLGILGAFLQLFLSRYRPRQVIAEFVEYTRREVDLRREADNAETFAANFRDLPDVVFPRIYRQYSGRGVLCMEFLDGFKPSDPRIEELSAAERDRVVDLGAAAIIRMLFKDGFFHADLHPGNLLVLRGRGGAVQAGFIDLGMVGRFDGDLRRTLLYYYYTLVLGDAENAARYLSAVAQPGPGADPAGFRREVTEILVRWHRSASFRDFSLGQLILQSVNQGAQHGMYFPVEMVLMVKALITFEGVGQILKPGLDVAAVSQAHIHRIFLDQFNPLRIGRESLRGAPELLDAIVKAPMLVTEGLRLLQQATQRHPENPLTGLRGTLFGGFCLIAGAVLAGADGPWPIWVALFVVGILTALRRR
ncbi:MAG TPA: AarF/UbiB family protein [Thermoanaerobaculia bacterium]|nr:AarF/UbiB family protein [Thermoanaerobaculia bacterium]